MKESTNKYANLRVLKSTNQLDEYAPYLCIGCVIAFGSFCHVWVKYADQLNACYMGDVPTAEDILKGKTCAQKLATVQYDYVFQKQVSVLIIGGLMSSFLLQLMQILSKRKKTAKEQTPLYCTAVVDAVAMFAQLSLFMNWFPVTVSAYGRVWHIARWAEWVAIVPVLMIMTHALDIRHPKDIEHMWFSTLCQLSAVGFGGAASCTDNVKLSQIFMLFACIFYVDIYFRVYLAYQRYKDYRKLKARKEEMCRTNSLRANIQKNLHSQAQYMKYMDPTGTSSNVYDTAAEIVRDKLASLDTMIGQLPLEENRFEDSIFDIQNTRTLTSVLVTFTCATMWTCLVVLNFLGCLNMISVDFENVAYSVLDVFTKVLYAQILCFSHESAMYSEESVLSTIIFLEEHTASCLQQFLGCVRSSLVSPIKCVVLGLDSLQERTLDDDSGELVALAKGSCEDIFKMINIIDQLGEYRTRRTFKPFDLKLLITYVASNPKRLKHAQVIYT
jgi:bacteriorhodopsin